VTTIINVKQLVINFIMSHLSKTTKRRRVDEELNCILNLQGEDVQCSHGEVLKQTDV